MRIVAVLISAICVLILCLTAGSAIAQNAPQSSLRGVVTDPSGARIPQAKVELRGPNGAQTQTTDANGQYEFPAVPPGRYDIQITAPDFKSDQKQGFAINGTA